VMSAAPAAIVYAVGSLICHQRPERSFHLMGAQLPVCARCFGIYSGAAMGAVAAAVSRRGRDRQRDGSGSRLTRSAMVVASVPTLLTLVVEWTGVWDPHNVGRAIAGTVLGAGVVMVVLTLHYDECVPRRPIAPHRPPTLT